MIRCDVKTQFFEFLTLTRPGTETNFEYDYVYNYLLSKIPLGKRKDSSFLIARDNTRILIYSGHGRGEHPTDVRKGDVLIHLSNESLRYDYRFLPGCNVVLRQYWHPFVWRSKCYTIPLGWQTGFGNHGKEDSGDKKGGGHSRYKFCFIGQIYGCRKPMYEAFRFDRDGFFSVADSWNSRQLTDRDVQKLYLDTAFALVPFGSVHADTMRIMEVLEWGCIPVVVKFLGCDYFKFVFGNHPFIVGKDWTHCQEQIDALWADKQALNRKLESVATWYSHYKKDLQADVTDIICGNKPTRGSQWRYQRWGRVNPWILASWYYHFYYKKKPVY